MEARAVFKNYPVSPRKVRRVANLIRGLPINRALTVLKFQQSPNAQQVEKVLLSAVANWQLKYAESRISETDLYVREVRVDVAPMIKRYRPVPHGRAHRIRKRANHLTLYVSATQEAISTAQGATSSPTEVPSVNAVTDQKEVVSQKSTASKTPKKE